MILNEIAEIKNEIKSTVKTEDLIKLVHSLVNTTVGEIKKDLRKEMETELTKARPIWYYGGGGGRKKPLQYYWLKKNLLNCTVKKICLQKRNPILTYRQVSDVEIQNFLLTYINYI